MSTEEVRGSAPAMTTKDMLLELYQDMKVVRPAVEALQAETLPARVRAIETRHVAEDARTYERGRLGRLGQASFAIIVGLVSAIPGTLALIAYLGKP